MQNICEGFYAVRLVLQRAFLQSLDISVSPSTVLQPNVSLTPLFFSFSFQAADKIKLACKCSPFIPVATRWNSLFYAVRWVLKRDRSSFNRLLSSLDIAVITDSQWSVLEEYVRVLTPIAEAITYLEGEDNMYLGHLLPVVSAVIVNLVKAKASLRHLKPLATYLVSQLKGKRFGAVRDSDHHRLAAYFHPERKLSWVTNDNGRTDVDAKAEATALMIKTLEEMAEERVVTPRGAATEAQAANQTQEAEVVGGSGGLFAVFDPSLSQPDLSDEVDPSDLVHMFLRSKRPKLSASDEHPLLRAAFIKFNTGLPSSASSERLFSTGKDILRPKRSAMSDGHFDMAMFLRGNRNKKF